MNDPGANNPTPQFGTAEYAATPTDACRFCHQPIGPTYYRLNDAMVCPSCFEKVRGARAQDSHAAYVRGITAGIGAAVVGLIAYAGIAIIMQGWVISIMSIGVGWLIGSAMMKFSNGVGGRRYQIAAVLLTYAAVSMAAIPIGLYELYNRPKTEQQKLADEQHQLENESGQQAQAPEAAPKRHQVSLGVVAGRLALLGLASPFYQLREEPGWGAMGLIILFVGMRYAWRITAGRPFAINGPFQNAPPSLR